MSGWAIALIIVALLLLWPITPRSLARLARRTFGYVRIARNATRNRGDYPRWLFRRPGILLAVNGYEMAVFAANGVEPRLKYLASLKASALTGCPF